MARYDYGYLRSWDDPKYIQQLYDQGYGGVLFQMDDPRLPDLVATARRIGLPYGIWGAPNQTPDGRELSPYEYARLMSDLVRKYGASVASLNLEFPYKGGPGSPEWNRSAELAGYWRKLVPKGVRTWIAPLGSQWAGTQPHGDPNFNFAAWKDIVEAWHPQAYGATLNQLSDPRLVVQALINAGIPAERVVPLIAPGQTYGGAALYGLNEFGDLPKAYAPETPQRDTGGPVAPTTSTTREAGATGRSPLEFLGRGFSQSPERIAQQGLQWFGRTFKTQQEFAQELQRRGQSYATWARLHRPAAQALAGRSNARSGPRFVK
jgi:hypothetical protein